ncbi:carotenoid oxygenase [Microbacterium faecale]|uniref:Dioxygenase n=1 Tax=Microbacterium faecale TaxID=1804630 RepID=A0A916Y1H6_9MICO|nr:carotenoid oxygenase family protein [Microbacterium faecale]GGD26856.1 carotenoid oxygenase [Microbacterium faecale]
MTDRTASASYRQAAFHPIPSFYGKSLPTVRLEADVYDCEIEGIVPAELNGTLYRLGGDTLYPVLGDDDNIINGDGLMLKFRIEDGHVDFRSRYVKTERYLTQRAARRRLYNEYRNPYTDEPDAPQIADRDNTGNTFAQWFNGRLFALREDSHPYEIDPDTLETLEKFDFDGKLKSKALSAHTKIDPVTGEWWAFGLFADRRFDGEVALIVADADGNLIREEQFQAPYPGLMHDFAVTREHVIFDIQPLTVDIERAKAGGDFYAYDPELPSMWGIMPRSGTVADIRWFRAPDVVVGHIMNAYTEGSTVIVDAPVSPGNPFPFFTGVDGNPTPVDESFGLITRLTFDLGADGDEPTVEPIEGAVGEMPRIDDRFAMEKYRYGFFKSAEGISRIDWATREIATFPMAPPSLAHEPIFVPRSADAAEGDGFIVTVVNHYHTNRGELLILDATDLAAGPIARAKIPFAPHFTFHGSFAHNV